MSKIVEILERVRAQSTVIQGAIKLITDLRIAIGEAIDNNDMAKLQELRQELDANTQALADALIEGTEIAPDLTDGPAGGSQEAPDD